MARIRKDVLQRQKTMEKYVKLSKENPMRSTLKIYKYPEDVNSYDELRKVYLRLADTADRRLRRLEEYSSKKEYADILKYAYAKAMDDIHSERGSDATRFKGGVPKKGNVLSLQSRINDVLKFLNSPTSTIEGVKLSYEQRARTLNDKYGMNLTWQEMANLFESGVAQDMISNLASDTAMKTIGKYYRNKDEIEKIFEKVKEPKQLKAFKSESTNTKLTAKQMRMLYNNKNRLDIAFD